MNRQEAIQELKRMAATIEWDYPMDAQIAIEKAVEALSGPTPDPITGLVPCGCGGKATFHHAYVARDDECYVECTKCGARSALRLGEQRTRDSWNTAMSSHTPSGAIGPETDGTAPNGDKGAGE